MKNIKYSKGLFIILFTFYFINIFSCKKAVDGNSSGKNQTIYDLVSNSPDLSLLKVALLKTGLNSTLASNGNLTLFAPNNAAFQNSTLYVDSLSIANANTDTLKKVLLYHVLNNILSSDKINSSNTSYLTASGDSLFAVKDANFFFINGVYVEYPNYLANNGVMHIMSSILSPPDTNTILEIISGDSRLSYLSAAINRANMGAKNISTLLSGNNIYTGFLPRNGAFKTSKSLGLGISTLDSINQSDPDNLASILLNHFVNGRIFTNDLPTLRSLNSLNNKIITFDSIGNQTVSGPDLLNSPNPANITIPDILVKNGVVQYIDKIL